MAKSTASTRIRKDLPTLPDELVRHDDIPGTGKKPKELEDLIRNNYAYFYAKGAVKPKLELQSVISGKDFAGWKAPLGVELSPGIPGDELERTAVGALKAVSGSAREEEPYRPEWATLAFNPRPANPVPRHFLRRRSGKLVAPEFVIGNDDRQNFFPNTWPWFCAGRIDVWKYGNWVWGGSGALVGKNVVMTASHMVPWGAGSGNWAMKFTPGYYDGVSTLGSGVYSYTQKAKGYSDYGQGDDMAVLKLYTPLGNSVGYFGYKTYNDDWEGGAYWTLIGYPGAVGGGSRPTRQSGIVITDDDSDGAGVELEHTGDATSGNSGGPLWAWWGDSPRVIGTHSGSEYNWDEDNNVAAGGSALSSLIKWARNNW